MFAVRLYLPCDTVRPRERDNAGSWHVCSDCCYPSRRFFFLGGGYLHDRPLRGVVYPSRFTRFPSMAGAAEEVYLCSAGEPPQERSPRCKWRTPFIAVKWHPPPTLLFEGGTHNRLTSINSAKDGELAQLKAKAVNSSIPTPF